MSISALFSPNEYSLYAKSLTAETIVPSVSTADETAAIELAMASGGGLVKKTEVEGTYQPVWTTVSGVTTAPTTRHANYMRCGNFVHVTVALGGLITSGAAEGSITLPIPPTVAFTTATQLIGTGSSELSNIAVRVRSRATTQLAVVQTSEAGADSSIYLSFIYAIA